MATDEQYRVAADWAEDSMTLDPCSTSALHGAAAAEHGRAALDRAMGGRPSIDPTARRGEHSRVRQVRLPAELDMKLDQRAALQHIRPSQIMREALQAYLADA